MSDPFHVVVGRAAISVPLTNPSQIFVPVRALSQPVDLSFPSTFEHLVLDNGGEVIAKCFTFEMAIKVAELINRDAGL